MGSGLEGQGEGQGELSLSLNLTLSLTLTCHIGEAALNLDLRALEGQLL